MYINPSSAVDAVWVCSRCSLGCGLGLCFVVRSCRAGTRDMIRAMEGVAGLFSEDVDMAGDSPVMSTWPVIRCGGWRLRFQALVRSFEVLGLVRERAPVAAPWAPWVRQTRPVALAIPLTPFPCHFPRCAPPVSPAECLYTIALTCHVR